jgi:hypothetical protein
MRQNCQTETSSINRRFVVDQPSSKGVQEFSDCLHQSVIVQRQNANIPHNWRRLASGDVFNSSWNFHRESCTRTNATSD